MLSITAGQPCRVRAAVARRLRRTDPTLSKLAADALTSVFAIVALVAGRSLGWVWMDPVMGVVGAVVIARWSWGLLRDTSHVLLDAEIDLHRREEIASAIEAHDDNRVSDLHLWRIGPR